MIILILKLNWLLRVQEDTLKQLMFLPMCLYWKWHRWEYFSLVRQNPNASPQQVLKILTTHFKFLLNGPSFENIVVRQWNYSITARGRGGIIKIIYFTIGCRENFDNFDIKNQPTKKGCNESINHIIILVWPYCVHMQYLPFIFK